MTRLLIFETFQSFPEKYFLLFGNLFYIMSYLSINHVVEYKNSIQIFFLKF